MYEGRLVRLRAFEPGDVDFFHRGMNDPTVRGFILMRYPQSRLDEERFVDSSRSISFGCARFVVEDRSDGTTLGAVDLRGATPEDRTADLGIVLADPAVWGRGYGTDAVRTVCRLGFEEMGLERIELWVFADNPRARAAYEKVGFVREGTARSRVYRRGARIDEHLMGLLRGELR